MAQCFHSWNEPRQSNDGEQMNLDQYLDLPTQNHHSETPWSDPNQDFWNDIARHDLSQIGTSTFPSSYLPASYLQATGNQELNRRLSVPDASGYTVNPQDLHISPTDVSPNFGFPINPQSQAVGYQENVNTLDFGIEEAGAPNHGSIGQTQFGDVIPYSNSIPLLNSGFVQGNGDYASAQLHNRTAMAHGTLETIIIKKQPRFTEEQNAVLQNWLQRHFSSPYPDANDISVLVQQTQLSALQIRNWFNRARQRKLQPREEPIGFASGVPQTLTRGLSWDSKTSGGSFRTTSDSLQMSVGYLDGCPGQKRTPSADGASIHSQNTTDSRMNSWKMPGDSGETVIIAWWLKTLPSLDEAKHAALLDFQNTPSFDVQNPPALQVQNNRSRAPTITIDTSHLKTLEQTLAEPHMKQSSPIFTTSPQNMVVENSDAISEAAVSVRSRHSSMSRHSVSSCNSRRSSHSSTYGAYGPRKGRRRYNHSRSPSLASFISDVDGSNRSSGNSANDNKAFRCDECNRGFTRKFTLDRHVNTMHQLEKQPWVCKMNWTDAYKRTRCCLCPHNVLDENCPHNAVACRTKSEEERSFYRKDNLMQHLTGVHKLSPAKLAQLQIDLDDWRVTNGADINTTSQEHAAFNPQRVDYENEEPKKLNRISTGERVRRTWRSGLKKLKMLQPGPKKNRVSWSINHST